MPFATAQLAREESGWVPVTYSWSGLEWSSLLSQTSLSDESVREMRIARSRQGYKYILVGDDATVV